MRALTGMGLKEAKEAVEGVPSVLKKEVKKDEAEEVIKKLTECVRLSERFEANRERMVVSGLAARPSSSRCRSFSVSRLKKELPLSTSP